MNITRCTKPPFSVIGREGSTLDGAGFIQRLWAEANAHFAEIEPLAKRDSGGYLCGLWGAMSDMNRRFQPWEDGFTRGLYLAGVECRENAVPPQGWTRWDIPGYEYLCAECDEADVFPKMLQHLREQHLSLAGAVHDFTCPSTGKSFMYFPIRTL